MKHKGWDIERLVYTGGWCATHPSYDPTPYESGGVWGDYDHIVFGSSKDAVIKYIDEWEKDNV